MKAYAISDPHGCAKTLQALVAQLQLGNHDQLFFLGDYVNKGPDSATVIQLLRSYERAPFKTTILQGNHDHLLVLAAKGEIDREVALSAGLAATLHAFGVSHPADIPIDVLQWLDGLPTWHQWEDYWMVHAGFNFLQPDPLQDAQSHRLIRNWYHTLDYEWLGQSYIVHGHAQQTCAEVAHQARNLDKQRVINIDAGCVSVEEHGKGYLCAFDLINRSVVFQPNLDTIPPPSGKS